MPLSGGRDSRHILLEAVELGARPAFCLTVRHHPPRWDEDADLAAQLAGALGLPHVILDQTEPRLAAELRKNLRTSFGSDEGTAFMAMGEYLAGRARVVFDGIGGDFLSDGRFVNERRLALLESGQVAELADAFLWKRPYVPDLLADAWRPRLSRRVAIARLQAELERHLDAPNPIASYIFRNRCRREIALFSASFYGEGVDVLCPYLDHDVVDFLLSLPVAVFLGGSFHAETVQRAYPAYAHIPFEPQGSPFLFDERNRQDLLTLTTDLRRYLDERTPTLLSAARLHERLEQHARAGKEPVQFSPQVIYALQLDRFVAELPTPT
jgi:asparagine synthetase B (glutamine-hydrolysing)